MSEELTRNVIDYVEQHPGCTARAVARGLKVKLIPVVDVLKALAGEGLIRRQMSKRYYRHWVVKDHKITSQAIRHLAVSNLHEGI